MSYILTIFVVAAKAAGDQRYEIIKFSCENETGKYMQYEIHSRVFKSLDMMPMIEHGVNLQRKKIPRLWIISKLATSFKSYN